MSIKYDIVTDVGATFELPLEWLRPDDSPRDLTGYTANMDVRDANNALVINLSTTNNRILLGGKTGAIVLKITGADMLTVAPSGTNGYVYDLFVVGPGSEPESKKLMYGTFDVNPSVTAVP